MTWKEKLISLLRHGEIVQRAIDPETGKPFPKEEPSISLRAAATLAKTPWVWRQLMKLAYMASGAISAGLAKAGASEDHTTAIVTGVLAAIAFLFEYCISWLCAKAKVDPPPFTIGRRDAASPFAPVAASPFALVSSPFAERPSIFNAPRIPIAPRQLSAALSPPEPESEPEPEPDSDTPAMTMPMTPTTKTPKGPLGEKNQKVIAEPKAGSGAPTIRGLLIGELDQWVLIQTDNANEATALSEELYDFYVQSTR